MYFTGLACKTENAKIAKFSYLEVGKIMSITYRRVSKLLLPPEVFRWLVFSNIIFIYHDELHIAFYRDPSRVIYYFVSHGQTNNIGSGTLPAPKLLYSTAEIYCVSKQHFIEAVYK